MCIGLEEEFEEMSMIGSGVYLGNSEAFYYPQHHVRSLVSGPGGYLLAIISQSASPHHEWYLSIWCHEHGMHCMGEYPLGLFSSKDNCLTSIIWHPSGQYIYLVIGGIVILVTWKIMNQERKVIGILEFLSSIVDSFDGYNHTLEFNIVKKFDEIEVTSLTLVDHGRTCFMGTLKNKNLLISTWKFDTVHYFSVSGSFLSLGIESKELNFILGSESKSDLDSTNHGVDSETSLSLIIPQSNTSDIIVGYTNENNLFFARSALSSYVEFAPFVVIEEYSGVIQLTTYQNSRTFETTIICLAYRDVSNHSSASIIDVDIVILRLLSNPGSSSGQLTVISRTPYISNFAKIMLTDIKKHSSIYFLQSSPTFSSHPDFVVAFGDRIIGYRLDSSAVFYNVESRSNFLLIIFVIHTNEASMEFNCSRKYSRVLHSCFASDRLVTASTIEYTRDLDDKLWEGSVLHLTSLLIDLQSTVYFPSKKSSGVLFNISEKQLYIFGSQSQFTSTSNLPSNCPPVKKIVKSEISSPPKSSKLKYWDHFSPAPGLSVFALEGGSQYHITKIPKTLHRDLILNSCRINYQEKPQLTLFACLNSSHLCGGGLLLSRESVGGIYFACTFDTSIHRHLENTSTVIWLHSIHTSKWKLIQPYRYPASSSSVLLLPWKQFQRKEVNRPSEPDVINSEFPRTRKQYFNSRCAILSIKRLSWFGNHTLVLCTQREQSKNEVKDSQASAQTPVVKRHFCIELLTRKTIDPIVIRHSIHQIPELPTETRRISFPHLQCIIPLPPNFAPSHLDIVPTKSHVDHMCCNYTLHDNQMDSTHSNNESDASFHREDEVFQIRRTINRSNSGGYEKQTFKHSSGGNGSSGSVNSGTSSPGNIEAEDSCFLLLGADTRFIAFHITATTHNLEDEMFSLNRASNDANNRRKYSNTTNFQDFVSFYPSSYRVNILWDIDIHSIPLYSPSLVPMNLTLPLQDAHLSTIFRYSTSQTTVSEESTHSFISHEQHESNDSKKKSIALTSLIVRDRVGKIAHLSFYNINSVDHTYECVGTVITLGLCSSINRLQHYLFPVTASSPSTLQDIYYLHSQSDNNDVIWLPHAQTSNHHAGGVILAVLKRPNSSNMFSSPNDNICSYLSYNSPLKLLGFSEHGPLKISQSVLTLHRTSLPLTIFLSMINTNPRQMDSNSFISEFLIPFYTYSSSSTHWLKYLLSHLSLHPYPLQRLTEGLEITLKTIINRDNFTRYNPEFAVLITILFSCDDVLFIEVMSRLSRKLEPHISASLFPLPNYQIRGDYKSSKSSSDSSQRIKNYRGLIINDSPWDQLALFELCLSRCALTHAARFLTPACEQLGGSQSLESVAASLILSHELLLECFRHLQLECALECLEFCMRLDVMAAELLHNQISESAHHSPVQYIVHSVGTQLVNGISYLNPLIGSDLHNLVEDTFQPHNSRSYSGINLYHFPLYKDSTANLRIHETATFQFNKSSTTNNDQGENIRAHAVAKSRYVYTAFAAWNQLLSNCRQGHVGSTSSFDLTTSLQETLLDSYSSIAMKHLITSLLQNSQIMSCAAVVSILNYHLSTSSSNTTTWFSRSFFSLSSQPLHFTKLLKPLIKAFNLLHCEIHPGKPAQSPQNHEMLKILNSLCPEFDIRKKCEMEMFVSHSEHQSDGGCLITFPSYHNNHLISTGNIHSQDSHLLGYTSISSHGRASSQFTIPILGDGKTFTISQLLRGLATTSLITQSYDILLFVAILHCRLDIVHHLLLYLHTNTSTSTQRTIISHENNSHYQILYQFCISQNNQMTQPYSLNISQYMNSIHTPGSSSSENEQLGDSHRGEELNQHEIKFMKWLCGTKIRSIHEISDGIERFLTLYSTNQEES